MRTVFVPIGEPERMLSILVEVDTEEGKIIVTAYHSILVSVNPGQSIVIQNEMNRMLVEHFGGSWEVNRAYVKFTIPLIQ